jgi:hypothetical protein
MTEKSIIQKIAYLESALEENKRELSVLQNALDVQKKLNTMSKANMGEFPPGFKFYYNNRRGDPQFTPFWCLRLDGSDEVYFMFHEGKYDENSARLAALKEAWRLMSISVVISAHQIKTKSGYTNRDLNAEWCDTRNTPINIKDENESKN